MLAIQVWVCRRKYGWIFLPSLYERRMRAYGDPADGDLKYGAAQENEMFAVIASNAERSNLESDSWFRA